MSQIFLYFNKIVEATRTPNARSLECEKVGDPASKLMRAQKARSVRVAVT